MDRATLENNYRTALYGHDRDAAIQDVQSGRVDYNTKYNDLVSRYGEYISPQEIEGMLREAGLSPTPTSGVTGSTAPSGSTRVAPVLNQAAVDATQAAINSLATEQDTGYRNIDDSYGSLLGRYDREKAQTEKDYGDQTVTNNTNLSKNKQNALLAASQGRRGLRATLGSLGALSGDGSRLADRAVMTSANQDIGEAADTYAGNAQSLDKALERFQGEDKDRRAEAETSRTNQRTKLEGEILTKRQSFLQKMAEIFGGAERTDEANRYLTEAGSLNEPIATKSRVAATAFEPRAAAFTPGTLESYLAGAGDMTVRVAPSLGGRGPTSILAGPRRKREDELVAA